VPRLGRRDLSVPDRATAARELAAVERLGGRLICWGEPGYPQLLTAVEDAPPVLTLLGREELLAAPTVAVVGARNASANGRRLAHELAAGLGEAGVVVVSGMARGIDAAAHGGALATGSVAVVAGGADVVYPEENRGLYQALTRDGAVVAELPLGTEPQARHFPRRNRIISGLARGVVVVEAAEGSGSLITANYALEQGREVFAVPGSPLDPRARGTNRLLRDGATLTETAEDVLAVLRAQRTGFGEPGGRSNPSGIAEVETGRVRAALEELLGPAPTEIDELVRQTGSDAATVLAALLELELAGRIERHPGSKVSLA